MDNSEREVIAARLRELEDRHGRVTADIILKDASAKSSPLHNRCGFIWNKDEAAHKYNLDIARNVLATVEFKIVNTDFGHRVPHSIPGYVRDPHKKPGEQGYINVERIKARSDDARKVTLAEIDAALSHLQRAQALGIALGFSDEVGDLLVQVERVRDLVANGRAKKAA